MGFVVKAVKSVVKVVLKIAKTVIMGGLGLILGSMRKKGNAKNAASDRRLSKQLDPEDFKKIVFGKTAMAVDLRYWEVYSPPAYNRYAEVLSAAGHTVNSFGNLYIEDDLVPFSGVNATGTYAGVLQRRTNNGAPGNAALSVGSGSYWNANSKFTGVAHYALDWLVDEKKLPNGVPSRYTQEGEGARVYDPRKDSTRGGSGTHRAEDQSTWEYSPLDSNSQPIGRNNALQMLWYLIGWRVQNPVTLEWTLICGRGVDLNDINFADFIAAANDAEALDYYSDMILSTGDDHEQNEAIISADGLFGEILDPGGLWTYKITKDDTADWAVHLTDDDVVEGEVTWDPQASKSEIFNEIAGTYIDPSVTSLYQPKAYPTVKDAAYLTADGGRRKRETHNFQSVQDPALAQKLARIKLNRTRFTGEFQATFNLRALKAQTWSVVKLSLEQYGFVAKWFRVISQSITPYGIEMLLREEDPTIYSGGTVTIPAAPSSMVKYNIRQEIAVVGLSGSASTRTGIGGAAEDGVLLSWSTPPGNVRRTEAQYKRTTDIAWATAMVGAGDMTACFAGPLLSNAAYEMRVRHVSIHEIPGPWSTVSVTTGANGRVVWTSLANRPPLLTGESVTVDEFLKDPSVWVSSPSYAQFLQDSTGEGYFEGATGIQATLYHLPANSTPIDPNATYEASFELMDVGAPGPGVAHHYTVIVAYDASNNIIAGDGTFWFYPSSYVALTNRNTWETHSALFGKGTARPFPSNAVRFGLGVLLNYDPTAGSTCRVRRLKSRRISSIEMQAVNNNWWTLGDGKAIRNVGPGGWSAQTARSKSSITGPQRFTFKWVGPNATGATAKMAGLSEVSIPAGYLDGTLSIYYTDGGDTIQIYEAGSPVATYSGITTRNDDVFAIEYDGLYLKPLRNGVPMGYTKFVGPGKTYKAYVDTYYLGQGITNIDHASTLSAAVVGSNTYNPSGTPWVGQNYATSSDNKIFNSDLLNNAQGWTNIAGAAFADTAGAGDPVPRYWRFVAGATCQVLANDSTSISIDGAKSLYASGITYRAGALAYFSLEVYYTRADGSASTITPFEVKSLSPSAAGVWEPFLHTFTPPVDATHCLYKVVSSGNSFNCYLGGTRFAPTQPGATTNTYRGDYAAGTTYSPGDIVQWTVASGGDGKGYGRIGSGNTTGVAPSDTSKWAVIVDRGGTGAPGATGASGLTISASPPAWPIACTFNGTPKSAVQGFQITVYQGGTNVTSSATYGTPTVVGLSGVSVSSGGAVTTTGMTADTGYILVPVTYGGATANIRVDYTKVKDGNAAVSGSAAVTSLTNSGTYATSANFNISLANGQVFNASANVAYGVVSSTYGPQVKLAYVNVTDGGAQTDIAGSEVTGPTVLTAGDIENVATSGSFTNSSGGTKVFNIRLLSRRATGVGNSTSVSGSVGGSG